LWSACGPAALILLLAAAPVLANGRLPGAGQVARDPGRPPLAAVRSTFGLLLTQDAGQSWRWVCETGATYADVTDPFLLYSDGRLLLATSTGLAGATDPCNFSHVEGLFGERPAIDLSRRPSDPATVWALTQDLVGPRVSRSLDGGLTWADVGGLLPGMATDTAAPLAQTLDVAPSDPQRLYATGVLLPQGLSVLWRSNDGGLSWQLRGLPAAGGAVDFLGAIDPQDPERVYLRRLIDGGGSVWTSPDGGASWHQLWSGDRIPAGLALAPDGKQLAIATPGRASDQSPGDLWRIELPAGKTTHLPGLGGTCLTWTTDGLWQCGAESLDGFTVARLDGNERTILLKASDLQPLDCAPSTRTGKVCPLVWPQVAPKLGLMPAATPPTSPPAETGTCRAGRTSARADGWWALTLALGGLAWWRQRRPKLTRRPHAGPQ
jgi:hypothetical protein